MRITSYNNNNNNNTKFCSIRSLPMLNVTIILRFILRYTDVIIFIGILFCSFMRTIIDHYFLNFFYIKHYVIYILSGLYLNIIK